jgi:glycosyltransferase involved in cell wall biosynthesis
MHCGDEPLTSVLPNRFKCLAFIIDCDLKVDGIVMGSVDIVIPNYNYGRYLRACVESVLTQGIDDMRVLIVDNASTDDSVEVARGLAEQDSRIEIVARETNLGPHASWNDGIDWARSDYLLILCADDPLAPGALACAIAVLDQNLDAVFAYGNDLIQDRHSDGAAAVECVGMMIVKLMNASTKQKNGKRDQRPDAAFLQ